MLAVLRLCIVYPSICLAIEEKITETPQSRNPKGSMLISAEHHREGLDWTADSCRPWLSRQATGSTLGQRRYLPSCPTRGFPTLANVESKLAVRALMWSANSGTSQIPVNLPVTNVSGDTRSRAKTLGLQHLQPPAVGAGGGLPCGARVIH